MNKNTLVLAAVLGLLTVAIGAFGAHGLKDILVANGKVAVFETGVKYQMMHALALLLVGFHFDGIGALAKWVANTWLVGVVIFSGSLYALAITNIGVLGAITPIGGLAFIVGWALLIVAFLRK